MPRLERLRLMLGAILDGPFAVFGSLTCGADAQRATQPEPPPVQSPLAGSSQAAPKRGPC